MQLQRMCVTGCQLVAQNRLLQLLLLLLAGGCGATVAALNVMECLQQRPLVDTDGHPLSGSVHAHLRQIRVPQSCVSLICAADALVVGWQSGVQFTSLSVDDTSADGRRCMHDVQRSDDNYHKANFPVTFYRAGDLQLVFHDSLCPAHTLDKQRFLLKSMLIARNVQPLEAYIICDGSLQVTRPTIYALEQQRLGRQAHFSPMSPTSNSLTPSAAAPEPAYRLMTHVTMFSPALPQERSSSFGDGEIENSINAAGADFAPQYARLQLSDSVVVSVLSECVGDERKMELLNELAAAWMGGLDSCLRLVCHAQLRSLALGHYQYLLYAERRAEGRECFAALANNGIGARVDTPLGSVRIISAGATTCEGTKFMVLEPSVAATSDRLQDFLYYQAYRVHAVDCPDLGVECLQRKLAALGVNVDRPQSALQESSNNTSDFLSWSRTKRSDDPQINGIDEDVSRNSSPALAPDTAGRVRTFPRQCTHLLCDSRTRLVRTNFSEIGTASSHARYRVRIDNNSTRELNNVCYRAVRGTEMSRRLYTELGSVEADVRQLDVKLIFSLL